MGLETPETPIMFFHSPTENPLLNSCINLGIIIIFCGAMYILYKMFQVSSEVRATVEQFARGSTHVRQNAYPGTLNGNHEAEDADEQPIPARTNKYYGLPTSKNPFSLPKSEPFGSRQCGTPSTFSLFHPGNKGPNPPPSPGAGPPNQHQQDLIDATDAANQNYTGSSTVNVPFGGTADLRFRNVCRGYNNGYGCKYGVNNSSTTGNISQSSPSSHRDLNMQPYTTSYYGMPRRTTTPSQPAPQYPTGSRIERSFGFSNTTYSDAIFDYRSSARQKNVSDWMDIDDRLGGGPLQYNYGFPRRR